MTCYSINSPIATDRLGASVCSGLSNPPKRSSSVPSERMRKLLRKHGLAREDFANLLEFQPEIVLLGTGRTIRFPHPGLTQDLTAARIGVDVMDVFAACRTFNVLTAEGRKVLAALILG